MAGVGLLHMLLVCLTSTLILATVSITDNGYDGIEIVIHENVAENLDLLKILEDMVIESSQLLYELTKQRAFFRNVSIVLPSSWSTKTEYRNVTDHDFYSSATVRVGPPNPKYDDTPYTLQPGDCGEVGRYIHFTPEFLMKYCILPEMGLPTKRINRNANNVICKKITKIFVNQWLRFKYGVFPEHGIVNSHQFPMFYVGDDTKIRGNTCPENLKGWMHRQGNESHACYLDRNANLIGDCVFHPDSLNDNVNTSIMFMSQLQDADHICEDDNSNGMKHNVHAPNEHNLKCGRRSVRNVIENSPDFHKDRNPPRDLNTKPTITFLHLQKGSCPDTVLILDTTYSMQRSYQQMEVAVKRFIKYKAKPPCRLGIISFGVSANILVNLTEVNHRTRDGLLAKIPSNFSKGNAIDEGLLTAVEVLTNNSNSADKGRVILFSDSQGVERHSLKHVTADLKDGNFIIYWLIFCNRTMQKKDISRITDGVGDFLDVNRQNRSLTSVLDKIVGSVPSAQQTFVNNSNEGFELAIGASRTGHFHVDKDAIEFVSVGFFYDYLNSQERNRQVPSLTVRSPSGTLYTSSSEEYIEDPKLRTVMLNITNLESGKWIYEIQNGPNADVIIDLVIASERGNATGDPTRVHSWISAVNLSYPDVPKVYAEVTKGLFPVLNANVSARVSKPDGDVVIVSLKDNGKGADTSANDGIYTEYYTHYNQNGQYAIDIVVDSNGKAVTPSNLSSEQLGVPDWMSLSPGGGVGEPKSQFAFKDLEQVDEEFGTSALYNPESIEPSRINEEFKKVSDFELRLPTGKISLENYTSQDLIPPGKIRDLKVTRYTLKKRIVTLQWTSPGDDMNDGQAKAFVLRYHDDVVALIQSFQRSYDNYTILKGTLDPPEPYQIHRVQLQLPVKDEVSTANSSDAVYFAVKTVDDGGNEAEISNVVLVQFMLLPQLRNEPSTFFNKYAMTGIGIGSGLCILGLVVFLSCFVRKLRREDKKKDDEKKDGFNFTEFTNY